MKSQTMPLNFAKEGEPMRIVALSGGSSFSKRMNEMGLNVGAELIVHQFSGSGMVLQRGETRIALGSGMVSKILVMRTQQ